MKYGKMLVLVKNMMMKRIIMICLLLVLTANNYSQKLSDWEIEKISEFEINLDNYDINDPIALKDMSNVLKFNKNRKWRKSIGIVFASVGVIFVVAGIGTINSNGSYSEDIGSGIIKTGIVSGAVSIPFLVSSSKFRKKRDKLLKKYTQ